MLHLKNITKDYVAGNSTVEALRGVDIQFRKSEFVSILGPSGCGKTTLLNILGGLDRYNSGDLIINGKSTKDFSERDWDSYRNHSIGFVFQTYNLIPHQSVLSNVELALTLSGVSKAERRKRATDALRDVGLEDQIHKKPNQLSGGQMQRVAIARALVNNPDIVLADEPTGALDSETSVQVMEILKEIARDRLVIMVTHNGELANRYATRIINLLDGRITGDTNPYNAQDAQSVQTAKGKKNGKTSMSFFTALSLSLNNLLTKKGRTILTAFAGSIGIIGISLILSLSNGFQGYIDKIQEDTLSTYPLTISETTTDYSAMLGVMQSVTDTAEHDLDKVYSNDIMSSMLDSAMAEIENNDLRTFKQYIEDNADTLTPLVNAVSYGYNVNLNIYQTGDDGNAVQVNPMSIGNNMGNMGSMAGNQMGSMMSSMMSSWSEMLDNEALLDSQYDLLAGEWPSAYNEVVVVVDENNEITDYAMYGIGLKDPAELEEMIKAMAKGETYTSTPVDYTYDEILSKTYKLALSTDYYEKTDAGWIDRSEDAAYMQDVLENALEIKIVGIIRPNETAQATSITGAIGYTSALTEYVIDAVNNSQIVKEQIANPETDVFTGKPFAQDDVSAAPEIPQEIDMSMIPEEMQAFISMMSEEELAAMMEQYMATMAVETSMPTTTYEENLTTLGVVDLDSPSSISLYPVDFESKDKLDSFIKEYNQKMVAEGREDYTITYTDYIGLMLSSVTTIVNAISYVLIAFVSISLVVSSIMIGIITYVSVLERTKEIGILKSIGASRKDISRVFTAESLIIGFVAGLLGICVTLLLNIPINLLIQTLTGLTNVANLPIAAGAILIALSTLLTLIAGMIPSRIAAKKDAVVALRTE